MSNKMINHGTNVKALYVDSSTTCSRVAPASPLYWKMLIIQW
jgi:hypothetical protein